MTTQERIAKIESLMNEVAAEMREIPGAVYIVMFLHDHGNDSISLQFDPGISVRQSLPSVEEEGVGYTAHVATVGKVRCYGHEPLTKEVADV